MPCHDGERRCVGHQFRLTGELKRTFHLIGGLMADKCGAKNRRGKKCGNRGMANGRCKFHGGMSTGPKKPNTKFNALKHGIYAKQLLPGELPLYRAMQLGSVDHEIRLTRLRLRRALIAETAANGELEIEEVITRDLVGDE